MSPEVLVASRPDASGRATSAPPPARQHRLVMPIVRDGQDAVKPGPTGHRGGRGLTAPRPPQPVPPRDQWIPVAQPWTLRAPSATFLSVRI